MILGESSRFSVLLPSYDIKLVLRASFFRCCIWLLFSSISFITLSFVNVLGEMSLMIFSFNRKFFKLLATGENVFSFTDDMRFLLASIVCNFGNPLA